MTINITASEIQVKNRFGQTKFTSSNKLVYLKRQQTNTLNISTGDIYESFYSIGVNEFLVLTYTINSCTGNVGAALIGKEIPANGSVIVDFNLRRVGNEGLADTDYIATALVGSNLVFKARKMNYNYYFTNSSIITNLTYKAKIYSYL